MGKRAPRGQYDRVIDQRVTKIHRSLDISKTWNQIVTVIFKLENYFKLSA